MKPWIVGIVIAALLFATPLLWAGEADVVDVLVRKGSDGTYAFNVTVKHADTGWDHFADKWEVLGPDGAVLGTRVLMHPHVEEQPFTRGLTGVEIPDGITEVTIRAQDKVHAWGGKTMTVKLP